MRYKAKADGKCARNSLAVHVYENEDEGEEVKRKINNNSADNWNNYYENKVGLPYVETVGVGEHAKTIEKKTEEEMLTFSGVMKHSQYFQTGLICWPWPISLTSKYPSSLMVDCWTNGPRFILILNWWMLS